MGANTPTASIASAAAAVAAVVIGATLYIDRGQRELINEVREVKALLNSPQGRVQQAPQPNAAANQIPPNLVLTVDDGAVKGVANAKLTILEFSDFECPFCARYSRDTYPQVVREYVDTGKARYAFRHFPVARLHPNATKASEAAECGRQQGRFWLLHDRLFQDPKALAVANLSAAASASGLDMTRFQACFNGEASQKVRQDLDAGARAGITGTPTFFIGQTQPDGGVRVQRKLTGAHTMQSFRTTLDALLAGS